MGLINLYRRMYLILVESAVFQEMNVSFPNDKIGELSFELYLVDLK